MFFRTFNSTSYPLYFLHILLLVLASPGCCPFRNFVVLIFICIFILSPSSNFFVKKFFYSFFLLFSFWGFVSCLHLTGSKRKSKEMPLAYVAFSSFWAPYATAHVSVLNEIAARIKEIKNKFQEICEGRQNFSLREEDGERRYYGFRKRPPSTSHVEEIGVIGREEDREKLIHLLTTGSSSFSVIPIVGMGGVGKTTLAQFIYHDVRVRQFFDQTAWISVSDDFDVIRLTKEVIESVTREPCHIAQPNILQEALMEKVAKRKLLLVLDDVWNKNRELWEHFRIALWSAQFVRILITTRDTSVAEIMQASVLSYRLGSLPDEKSLILFRNCAFGTQDVVEYSDLVEIGNQIVRKCDGLPLAIKVLGGILRYDRDIDTWREVLECYTWELDAGREEILSALKLSYYRMPSHLRPCFLYFSMFPKDHEFRRDLIIRMWMAQGYIHAQSNKRLEDIGIKYFEELYGRSLLLPFNKYGEVMYKMHVMIHELAMSLSKRICSGISYGVQHLYAKNDTVLPGFPTLNNHTALRTLVNYSLDVYYASCSIISTMACLRVLEVEVYGTELPDSIDSLKHLRYLGVIGRKLRRLPESLCVLYNLQTLDLQHSPFLLELPSGIGNLINLRYIRLYSEEMNKLPESICWLPHLQILDVKCCCKLSELPSGIEQLTSLRCLEISHSNITCMVPGVEKLTNLQHLGAKLIVDRDDNHKGLAEVKDLINLRGTFCISGLQNIVDVECSRQAHLISKNHLHKLKLRWRVDDRIEDALDRKNGEEEGLYLKVGPSCSGDAMDSEEIEEAVLGSLQPHKNIKSITIHGYNGLRFPKWVGDPVALSKLTEVVLWDCNLEENNLSCLGELPSLKYLRATGLSVAFIGENDYSRRYSGEIIFPSLETLELRYMKKWKGFHVVNGAFPCLKKLSVEICPKLLEVPRIPSLQFLFIIECQSVEQLRLFEYINEKHPLELHTLVVRDCPNLFPKFELRCLNKLKQLEITDCALIEISLPIHSELQYIHITRCRYLHSVYGLEHINSITDMQLASCPFLEFKSFAMLGCVPQKLRIIDCPKLSNWCQKCQVNYFQVQQNLPFVLLLKLSYCEHLFNLILHDM